MWRPVFQVFEFGEQKPCKNRKGEDVTRADISIDVCSDCSWSINHGHTVVLGSADHNTKRRFYDRKTPPRNKAARQRWLAVKDLFGKIEKQVLTVTSINVRESGAFTISMKGGYKLECIPSTSDILDLWWFSNHETGNSYLINGTSITEFD